MKRTGLYSGVVLLLAAASVWSLGCTPTGARPSASATSKPSTAQNLASAEGTPDAATAGFANFAPLVAADFSDGLGVFGFDETQGVDHLRLVMMRPAGAADWSRLHVSEARRDPSGATNIGGIKVLIGSEPASGPPGSPQLPFIGVSSESSDLGLFKLTDVGQSLFSGRSASLNAIARTAAADSPDARFVVVGGTVNSPNGELGNPVSSIPCAFTSKDGVSWQAAAALPLPSGVEGAEASSVAYAPPDTAYPGIVVGGTGWTSGADRHTVGILWQSADGGQSWKIVSGDDFSQAGRDMSVEFVAADDTNIVAAGTADVVTQGQKGQTGALDWTISADGKVDRQIDTLDPGRSSSTLALVSRPGGGFLTATQLFDTGTSPSYVGEGSVGNPVAHVWSTADGHKWVDQTSAIKDMKDAMVIQGIAEYGSRAAFWGLTKKSVGVAYVVDSASLK